MDPHQDRDLQQAFLTHYEFLRDSGIQAHIDRLTGELRGLEALVTEAAEIFHISEIDKLTQYIAQKLLDKFIPSWLAFVVQSEFGSDKPTVICFQNMKRTEPPLSIPSLEPYRYFFGLSPVPIDFSVFEYMVGQSDLTDVFLPLRPEKLIPILGFDGVHGFIVVGKKILGEPYTELEMRYLGRLVNFVSISFQNSLHYQSAITDRKTHLYNHSYFMRRLEEEQARIRRYRMPLTVVIFDIDHFKRFNTEHGHLAGDLVLAEVARCIASCVRTEDVPARFGGEEFVVLLVQCKSDFGLVTGERIRRAVESLRVTFEGKELSVSISAGVAECLTVDDHLGPEGLLKRADKALYASKNRGRNQTTLWNPSLDSAETEVV
ncbi:MAG: GGDEF domain-containing protein [Spirochaetales bacterium]